MTTRNQETPSTTLLNDTLRRVCMVLFVIGVITMIYNFSSIPLFYHHAVTQTLPKPLLMGMNQVDNIEILRRADIRGMNVQQYVIYRVMLDIFYTLFFYIVSFMIIRRARGNWFLWFTALVLFFIPGGQHSYYAPQDALLTRIIQAFAILWPAFPLLLYLFPNGKAVPRRMLWLLGPLLILFFGVMVFGVLASLMGWQSLFISLQPYFGFVLISLPVAVIAQVYRYIRVSTREERQQTKWVLGGLIAFIAGTQVLTSLFHMTNNAQDYGFPTDISTFLIVFLPVTIGISVLRYRLYDIDLIIRRTLQYGILSVFLGLMYFGLVALLGQLFRGVTGQNSPVAIVISTLVIAALFGSLRIRIQRWIDRRFYRAKYDADQAVESFSITARSQVELETLATRLAETAQESLQPEGVWVWIRKQEKQNSASMKEVL
jgi:hypothetical protein